MATKEELELYGQIKYQHKLSIRTIIREFFLNIFAKKYRVKESMYFEEARFPSLDKENGIVYFAVVDNNKVVELVRMKGAAAEAIRSPKIKFVEFDPANTIVKKGMLFKNKKFIEERKQDEIQEN